VKKISSSIFAAFAACLLSCGPPKPAATTAPAEPPPPNPCPAGAPRSDAVGSPLAPEFDRDAALRAMQLVNVSACGKKGASGCAQVQLQWEPTGNVSAAWACETTLSSEVRACIEKKYKALAVSAFRDRPVFTRANACVGGATR